MQTPIIPDWVRGLSHPLYRNIFSYDLGNKNLWGTETLLGDWGGAFLLVAQDFYPTSWIEERRHLPNPYSHNPAAMTNIQLLKTLRRFSALRDEHTPSSCNFLYISACFLLRAGSAKRAPLPDATNVLRLSAPVVEFTMDNMPNLKTVVLMGGKAEASFRVGGGMVAVKSRGLQVHTVSHPARAMTDRERFGEWEPVLGPA